MVVDATTKSWIRNRSDEIAVAAGCIFDAERGKEVCDWIETHCHLYEGTNALITLGDWQREATMRMFGWIKWNSRLNRWVRRFTRASIWLPKKNAKSPTAAAWALYLLAGDGEPGNHVFFAAADKDQAKIVAKHALEMVLASPQLDEDQGGCIGINRTEMKLMHRPTLSDAKPISSADKRAAMAKQGLNGSVIVDECHCVTRVFMSESSIDKAGASRDEPMHIEVSTAGKDPDGYGRQQYLYGKQVESGEREDQGFFFLAYEAPQELTDEELDADPVKYGKLANPTWGRIIQEEEFLADYNRSKRSLADLSDFKTFRLNIWQTTLSPWIRKEDWLACRGDFTEDDMAGRQCCAGFDLGITRDMTALAFAFRWEGDRFRLLVYFFMPEASVTRLALLVPQVHEWVRDGWIIVGRGHQTTDYKSVKEFFAEKCRQFAVEKIIYDAYSADQITSEMEAETGVERFKLPQSKSRYNEPTQNFERCVIEHKMEHNGNPVLTWQMGHCNIDTDKQGNQMPAKPPREDHKKIDGCAASIMGFAGAWGLDPEENWFAAGGGLRD